MPKKRPAQLDSPLLPKIFKYAGKVHVWVCRRTGGKIGGEWRIGANPDTHIEIGTEVTLVWGEEGGGSSKPVVERHRQAEFRAIVSPAPYSEVARSSYHEGWRSKAGVA